jgi:serine/threonine protein kinase
VGNLKHDNILFLHDLIEEADSLYLVMELVPGGSLAKLTAAKRRFQPHTALGIVRQVAAALDGFSDTAIHEMNRRGRHD